MLQKLEIRNYILIDELSIEFNDGLSIITGETGSGKSILLGAINQLLGNRIDHKIVGPKKINVLLRQYLIFLIIILKTFLYIMILTIAQIL